MDLDLNAIITTTLPALVGIGSGLFVFYRGIHDYREGIEVKKQENEIQRLNLTQRRKDIIFPFTEKFRKSLKVK